MIFAVHSYLRQRHKEAMWALQVHRWYLLNGECHFKLTSGGFSERLLTVSNWKSFLLFRSFSPESNHLVLCLKNVDRAATFLGHEWGRRLSTVLSSDV